VSEAKTPDKAGSKSDAELYALVRRAEAGDESAMPAVRDMLNQPAFVDLAGDLARYARKTLIDKFTGKNLVFKEGVTRKVEGLQAELAGPAATPLERLLAERVATCWLHLHHLEQVYSQKESMPLQLGMYFQRGISAAHKRYLTAIKTLAAVRKLAAPVVQVNIAKKQVNIAAPAASDVPTAGGEP
jgi:hypothetical protein